MRPCSLLTSTLILASTSYAWPFEWRRPAEALQAVKRELEPLLARAPATTYDLSYSSVQGNTATTTSATSTATDASTTSGGSSATTGSAASSSSGGSAASTTGTDSSSSNSTTSTSSSSSISINPVDGAGGVAMITPAATAAASYYKIEDYVTFAWNYTSLSVTPSAIDILASCSANDATYTIALNQSVSGATGAVTWDTGAYQSTATIPLLTETYTLIIHDAAKAVSAVASAGYFATYEQFTFGMYIPQPYTPIADYVCATCNGAMSMAERQTLSVVLGTVVLTVVGFGWFTGVAGLW